MEFKGIFTLITVALLAYCVQITVAFPRDVSIVKTEEITKVINGAEEKMWTQQILDNTTGRLILFYLVLTFVCFAHHISFFGSTNQHVLTNTSWL